MDCRKKKTDQKKKGASSETEEQGNAYLIRELFLVTTPSVAEVRYVDPKRLQSGCLI